jgi:hypothetical protein
MTVCAPRWLYFYISVYMCRVNQYPQVYTLYNDACVKRLRATHLGETSVQYMFLQLFIIEHTLVA